VKAVGDNPESKTPTEIQKKIVLGARQLVKDENILRWVLQDLPEVTSCHVTRVVALPNLTRQELASFWPPAPADLDPSSEEAKHVSNYFFVPGQTSVSVLFYCFKPWGLKSIVNWDIYLLIPFFFY
jgi:hypothetical protein